MDTGRVDWFDLVAGLPDIVDAVQPTGGSMFGIDVLPDRRVLLASFERLELFEADGFPVAVDVPEFGVLKITGFAVGACPVGGSVGTVVFSAGVPEIFGVQLTFAGFGSATVPAQIEFCAA